MDKPINPFSPGAGTSPPALVGRSEILDRMTLVLRRLLTGAHERSVFLVGLRGVGKTVLLRDLTSVAQAHRLQTIFMEASDDNQFAAMLALRLRQPLLGLTSNGLGTTLRRALAALRGFSVKIDPTLAVTVGINIDPIPGLADSGVLEMDLPDLFAAIGAAAKDHHTGLFIAIDEVQYLSKADLKALIVAVHRAAQEGLPILVAGAGLPQLIGQAGDAKSYVERLFQFEHLGPLSEEDTAAAIREPALERDVTFTDGALHAIFEHTHGYPYFVQEWAFDAWDAAPSARIDRDVIDTITPTVIARLDANFFRVRFDRLAPKERTYLRALAELGPGAHRTGAIAAVLGTSAASLGTVRDRLLRKGMVYAPAYGLTEFTFPLFDEFMKRSMPAP